MPVKQGNRRLAVFDTNAEMRGNKDYFIGLANHLKNPKVKWAFYQFLKTTFTYNMTPIEFQNSIPNTDAYREVRILNAPIHLKWIVNRLRLGALANDSVRNLYISFKNWLKENKEGSEDHIISETAFGLLLNKSKEAQREAEVECLVEMGDKKKSTGVMIYRWNIENVVVGLKKLYLLEEESEDDNTETDY